MNRLNHLWSCAHVCLESCPSLAQHYISELGQAAQALDIPLVWDTRHVCTHCYSLRATPGATKTRVLPASTTKKRCRRRRPKQAPKGLPAVRTNFVALKCLLCGSMARAPGVAKDRCSVSKDTPGSAKLLSSETPEKKPPAHSLSSTPASTPQTTPGTKSNPTPQAKRSRKKRKLLSGLRHGAPATKKKSMDLQEFLSGL